MIHQPETPLDRERRLAGAAIHQPTRMEFVRVATSPVAVARMGKEVIRSVKHLVFRCPRCPRCGRESEKVANGNGERMGAPKCMGGDA